MTCTHRNDNNTGPLICQRTDPHTTGHTYEASAGADLGDERGGE